MADKTAAAMKTYHTEAVSSKYKDIVEI